MSGVEPARLGVVGGSGLYAIEGLEDKREVELDTPFGRPSDRVTLGVLEGMPVAFLARHGRGHRLMPTEINFRANLYALKSLGCERVVSASAVGSLREEVHPLDVVVVDQFIDRTRHRAETFFGDGIVGHVSLARPVCPDLARRLAAHAHAAGARVHEGGCYVGIEGPQFSTRAESELYRSWGGSVIGMTNVQEARLAREAELCYATLALVTDYDCWKDDEEPVSVEQVVARLEANAALAARVVTSLARELAGAGARSCPCARALDGAVITDPGAISDDVRRRLEPIAGRVLSRR